MPSKNPNYLTFTKAELVLAFTSDRGELRTNDMGEFFYRRTMDGRFTCASPELERCLVDANYTANQRVGITKLKEGRSVYWKVRLIDAVRPIDRAADGCEPSKLANPSAAGNRTPNGGQRQEPSTRAPTRAAAPATKPPPIPESKYATPLAVEGAPLEAQLTASIAAVKAAKEAPVPPPAPPAAMTRTAAVTAGMDQVCDAMQHCLTRALNMICAAQKSAIEQGCAINFLGADVQDLASTIYIQLGRTAEQNARNQNGTLRANGGASPWAH